MTHQSGASNAKLDVEDRRTGEVEVHTFGIPTNLDIGLLEDGITLETGEGCLLVCIHSWIGAKQPTPFHKLSESISL